MYFWLVFEKSAKYVFPTKYILLTYIYMLHKCNWEMSIIASIVFFSLF